MECRRYGNILDNQKCQPHNQNGKCQQTHSLHSLSSEKHKCQTFRASPPFTGWELTSAIHFKILG